MQTGKSACSDTITDTVWFVASISRSKIAQQSSKLSVEQRTDQIAVEVKPIALTLSIFIA